MKRWLASGLMVLALALAAGAAEGPAASEAPAVPGLSGAPVIGKDDTAMQILEKCRKMVPADFVIKGHVNRRSRHGTEIAAYRYDLTRKDGKSDLKFFDKAGAQVPFERGGRLLDTDIVESDLTLEFLWWEKASLDADAPSKLSGIVGKVLLIEKDDKAYRAWINPQTGAMMEAHELRKQADGSWKPVREVFCTSFQQFGDRWAPRHIEVGPPGAKYRTKIVVEEIK